MSEQTPASAALKSLRQISGLSIRAVADALQVPLSTYSSYERTFKRPYLPMEIVTKLLNILVGKGNPPITSHQVLSLGIPEDQIEQDHGRAARYFQFESEPLLASSIEEKLVKVAGFDRHKPVLFHPVNDFISIRAVAKHEAHAHFQLLDLQVGATPRPRGIADDAQAFAFFSPDDRLSPRWKRGEIVFVEPFRPALTGDHAIFFCKRHADAQEEVYFAKFKLSVDGFVALEYYDCRSTTTDPTYRLLPRSEITSIWRVYEWPELLG